MRMNMKIWITGLALAASLGTAAAQNTTDVYQSGRVINAPYFDAGHRLLFSQHDFTFGYKGEGDASRLREKCAELMVGCDIIEPVLHFGTLCSSTHIRELLKAGKIEYANEFLGHPYVLTDYVRYGYRLGRTLEKLHPVLVRQPRGREHVLVRPHHAEALPQTRDLLRQSLLLIAEEIEDALRMPVAQNVFDVFEREPHFAERADDVHGRKLFGMIVPVAVRPDTRRRQQTALIVEDEVFPLDAGKARKFADGNQFAVQPHSAALSDGCGMSAKNIL